MNRTSLRFTPGALTELPNSLAVVRRRQSKSPRDSHCFLIKCLSVFYWCQSLRARGGGRTMVSSFEDLLQACRKKDTQIRGR